MSRMETIKGTLTPVKNIEGETNYDLKILELVQELESKPEVDPWNADDGDTALEFLQEETNYEKYEMIDGVLYHYSTMEELDECGFALVEKADDGSLNFFVSFYNGGACLSEVIIDELKNQHER